MRLSFLILSLAVPAAAESAAAPPPAAKAPGCPADRMIFADRKGDRRAGAQPKKLGELPPGKLYLSVDRKVAGCRKPAILRYNIGAVDAVAAPGSD